MLRASRDADVLSVIGCALLFLVAVTATFTATEAEKLGRRTALRVPRNRALALLVSPFLPGGGRGVLLFGLHVALIAGGVWMSLALTGTPAAELWGKGGWSIVVLSLYLCVYVLLPARLCSSFTGTVRGRIFARLFILLFVLAATFLPTIIGFFLQHRPLMSMEHSGHPIRMMDKVWSGRVGIARLDGAFAVIAAAATALALNLSRAVRGALEVAAASRARAAAERRAGESSPDPAEPEAVAGG